MTASVVRDDSTSASSIPEPFTGLEVVTVSVDTLRAGVRVAGTLSGSTAGLLASILRTHTNAGRRYLRVDLAAAEVADDQVVVCLGRAHRHIVELGGMLIFENAGPKVIDAIRNDALFVRPRQ